MISVALTVALLCAPQDPTSEPAPAATGLAFERLGESGFRVRFDEVPGVADVTLWLGVEIGSAHDPISASGLAAVLGEVLRSTMPPANEYSPREIKVLREATLIGVTVRREDAARELERFARWLSGELLAGDDDLLRARGRALLRADDEAEILPGPLLRARAHRLLCGGTPAMRPIAGVPEQIRSIGIDALRGRLREAWRADRAFLIALGRCDEDLRAVAARVFGELPAGDGAAPSIPAPRGAGEVVAETPHGRVAAPFVALALPVPRFGDPGYLPFLIAIEIARTRSAHTFGTMRGGEFQAEFPPIDYDVGRMPLLAFVERRGHDDDDVERVRAEVRDFVTGMGADAPRPGEVRASVLGLRHGLELPPFREDTAETMRRYPAFLHQRGGTLALYAVHGWPTDLFAGLEGVTPADVQRALADTFGGDRGRFVSLAPD